MSLPPTNRSGRPYPATRPTARAGHCRAILRCSPNLPAGRSRAGCLERRDAPTRRWRSVVRGLGVGRRAVRLGDGRRHVAGARFTTAGLTAGIDWRVHDDLIVGAAVGYGSDRSDGRLLRHAQQRHQRERHALRQLLRVRSVVHRRRARLWPARLRQSPFRRRRRPPLSPATARAATGSARPASATSSSWRAPPVPLRAGRFHAGAARPAPPSKGGSAELLSFAATKFHSLAARSACAAPTTSRCGGACGRPNARVEFRQTLDGAFDQSLYYSDLGASVTSTLAQASATRAGRSTPVWAFGRGVWAGSAEDSNTAPRAPAEGAIADALGGAEAALLAANSAVPRTGL